MMRSTWTLAAQTPPFHPTLLEERIARCAAAERANAAGQEREEPPRRRARLIWQAWC